MTIVKNIVLNNLLFFPGGGQPWYKCTGLWPQNEKNYTDRKILCRSFLSFETKYYLFQTNGISFTRKGTLLFMWRRDLACFGIEYYFTFQSCVVYNVDIKLSPPPYKSPHFLADFVRRSWTLKISIPTLRISDLLCRRLWPQRPSHRFFFHQNFWC